MIHRWYGTTHVHVHKIAISLSGGVVRLVSFHYGQSVGLGKENEWKKNCIRSMKWIVLPCEQFPRWLFDPFAIMYLISILRFSLSLSHSPFGCVSLSLVRHMASCSTTNLHRTNMKPISEWTHRTLDTFTINMKVIIFIYVSGSKGYPTGTIQIAQLN